MKVFVDPIPITLSRAMFRVAKGLRTYVPDGIEIVDRVSQADLQVLHVIGPQVLKRHLKVTDYAVIQYCLKSVNIHGDNVQIKSNWEELWKKAKVVWSYYDLLDSIPDGERFYYAPIGVDDVFINFDKEPPRNIDIMTSGFVTGPGAEAIEEVAIAAHNLCLIVKHLGPDQIVVYKTLNTKERMHFKPSKNWSAVNGITDEELARIYKRSRWVSGLRQIEGFELPVIEGLVCGARPIVFDRPEMRHWYNGHAVFIPECRGNELVERLVSVLKTDPKPVTIEERRTVVEKFDWAKIAKGFWNKLLEGMN